MPSRTTRKGPSPEPPVCSPPTPGKENVKKLCLLIQRTPQTLKIFLKLTQEGLHLQDGSVLASS